MKTLGKRLVTLVVLAMMTLGVVFMPSAALASRKGRLNTARILTGIAGYQLLRGHTGTGILLGAGAAYAWKREKDAKHHRWISSHRIYHRHHRVARAYR